ncbi:hypothetical protein LPTSP3_g16260 [Leptospira kobayashii]|uniref:YCII-related domain-containing protein n=1 Tax=Leptospira kobayashii TaxID=1917830 RepID=A0ABN6KFW2_9LEPT|nr:YciI family protein [Leptospira kobayashii]BDA78696.1 hypothetical protein LPTSP3_g16260 [Leptospira kobayashii]
MKQFVVLLRYLVPLETVEKFVTVHREYLSTGYSKKLLLATGPQNPRSGGVLLARATTREEVQKFCDQDPFCIEGVAEYQIIEWVPVKWLPEFESWKDGK